MHILHRKIKAIGVILGSALFIVATQIPTIAGEKRCRCFSEKKIERIAHNSTDCAWEESEREGFDVIALLLYNITEETAYMLMALDTDSTIGTGCVYTKKPIEEHLLKKTSYHEYVECRDCIRAFIEANAEWCVNEIPE